MAINYTSYIPRQVIDTGTPLEQAPDFSRLMDRPDWSNREDPYGFSRYQYLTPSDFRYWASQKQEGGDPSQAVQDQTQGASAPQSDLDKERARLRAKFQAPLHDESNAWVQSANRGRQAIDNGQALKPTPAVFSKEFATRELPSGSPNDYINYDTLGDEINEKGIQLMRDTGTWSEDELANPGKIKMNYGMHEALNKAGGIRHTQKEYEDWVAEQERQRQAMEAAMMQRDYGPYAQDAMAAGVPANDSSLVDSSLDWSGYNPSSYPYEAPSSTNTPAQSSPSSSSDPFAQQEARDPIRQFGKWLYSYNQGLSK